MKESTFWYNLSLSHSFINPCFCISFVLLIYIFLHGISILSSLVTCFWFWSCVNIVGFARKQNIILNVRYHELTHPKIYGLMVGMHSDYNRSQAWKLIPPICNFSTFFIIDLTMNDFVVHRLKMTIQMVHWHRVNYLVIKALRIGN